MTIILLQATFILLPVSPDLQFDKMLEALWDLQQQVAQGKLNHVSNYKNANGAPLPKEKVQRMNMECASIRVLRYLQADTSSDFRYVPDGMLVRVLTKPASSIGQRLIPSIRNCSYQKTTLIPTMP